MERFLLGLVSFLVMFLMIMIWIMPDTPGPRTVVHCPQYHHQEKHLAISNEVAVTHVWCIKNILGREYHERED